MVKGGSGKSGIELLVELERIKNFFVTYTIKKSKNDRAYLFHLSKDLYTVP